jgi:hypothetical protein
MKWLIILVLLCGLATQLYSQCNGNACSAVSIVAEPNGSLSIRNNDGTRSASVSVRWFYFQCQNANVYNVNPGQTLNFPTFKAHCPPYAANFNNSNPPPPPSCNAQVVFVNPAGSGGTVYLYGVVSAPNAPAYNFCTSTMVVSAQSVAQGQTFSFTIPNGGVLVWKSFDQAQCNENAIRAYGSIAATACCGGCRANVR